MEFIKHHFLEEMHGYTCVSRLLRGTGSSCAQQLPVSDFYELLFAFLLLISVSSPSHFILLHVGLTGINIKAPRSSEEAIRRF